MSFPPYATYFQYFWKRKIVLAIAAASMLLAALVYTAFQPFEYSSSVQMIVVQGKDELDSYTASRAAERSAKTLSHVVGTTSFFQSVLNSDSEIKDVFGEGEEERRTNWKRSIDAGVTPDTGVLTLVVYSESADQAERIAYASAQTIATQQWKYLGTGTTAQAELIDAPFTSTRPVRPNLFVNIAGSLVLGVLMGLAFVIVTDPQLRGAENEKPKPAAQSSGSLKTTPVPEPVVAPTSSLPTHLKKISHEPNIDEVRYGIPDVMIPAVPVAPMESPVFAPVVSEDVSMTTEVVQGANAEPPPENTVVIDGTIDRGLGLEKRDFFTMQDHLKRLRENA